MMDLTLPFRFWMDVAFLPCTLLIAMWQSAVREAVRSQETNNYAQWTRSGHSQADSR